MFTILDGIGCQIGAYLINKLDLNPKIVLTIGGLTSLTSMTLASTVTNFWHFVVLNGISGIGYGINYFVPMVCSWDYFPSRKGFVTGILVAAYGLGGFTWTLLSTEIVNPDNEKTYDVGIENLKYFRENVARRVPLMYQILVSIWVIQLIIATLLVSRPRERVQRD